MSDQQAPKGSIFVCAACGKTSPTHYGLDNRNGWDESCMLNAVLCKESDIVRNENGRVLKIEAYSLPD